MSTELATLGGGCFWCLEAALSLLDGVRSVTSGYCGGRIERPTYQQICTGNTDHAEVVRVEFDPAVIDYRTLLTAFFAIHDPTTADRQGHDIGTQYRSVIYTHSPEQESTARALIAELDAENIWPAPIVTAVLPAPTLAAPHARNPGSLPPTGGLASAWDGPAPTFWPAEDYHQNYFAQHPAQAYCQAVVAPKVAKLRKVFAAKLKSGV
ncbi:MAG: peptide-methionine (S)-S-oxide reductase MsrA [Rhodocyclaceae bacterium]|nr:peptide-methionine (S)-S-oxide reductase MsrA [Rhodocyclaceae bacterium]